MARDLFAEAGIVPDSGGPRDLFAEAGIVPDKPAKQEGPSLSQMFKNELGGLARGAGRIGSTLVELGNSGSAQPFSTLLDRIKARNSAVEGGTQALGADPQSLGYKATDLAAQVAGTGGVGPGLARAAAPMLAAKAAPLLSAIGSAGFKAGGLGGLSGLATRSAGGAITGGAATALVDPESAGTGAAIGGVMPGALQALGRAGSAVFRKPSTRVASRVLDALEGDPASIAAQLRAARELVPGSNPTVAQALGSPQASVLERVVSDSPGGAALKQRYLDQNAARFGALDSVAPIDPRGFASARQDTGATIAEFAKTGDAAARGRTSAMYQSIPQDEAALYLPELGGIRDKFFGRGVVGGRDAIDSIVAEAEKIGAVDLRALRSAGAGKSPKSLAQAVRSSGGLSLGANDGLRGELAGLRGDFKNLVRPSGGMAPSRMAEKMHQAGYIADDDAATLLNALRDEATGGPVFSAQDDLSRQWSSARDASMGVAPGAERVPAKVTLGEFDSLRGSIGNAQRAAARDPARAREALALSEMKKSLDDRLNEVVRGDGAIDEVLPIDWADKLTQARQAKVDQVKQFRTGPQASLFRVGADGQPMVQGGEAAAKFWGMRPGLSDDVKAFRSLIGDNQALLGQFRSLVATEGASTATNAGALTGKFVRWVDNTLPGLNGAFDPDQVKTLQRIAQDIRRAEAATAAGASKGSPTFSNAANALSLGVLDSPAMGAVAGRIPLGSMALGGLRDWSKNSRAKAMSGLLLDPEALAGAITSLRGGGGLLGAEFQQGLLRAAPLLGGGR